MGEALRVGDEQKCQRCGSWHVLEQATPAGTTPYAQSMLYVTCCGQVYFAGQIGQTSRTPTRPRS